MLSALSWLIEASNSAICAIIVASCLPFIFALTAKILGGFSLKDNSNPRQFLEQLTGAAARANAAQNNGYESLPIFLVSVVLAMFFFVPQPTINMLAWLYVVIRIAYGIAYIINLPTFRSILWGLSIACIFMLFTVTMKITL